MNIFFKTENLAVGYNGKSLIKDINISLEKGKILTLIGPNGAGKSTILKSITGQLEMIEGAVFMEERELCNISAKELARNVAVFLTERIRPELMTCAEVVAMGRYPYTNMFGKLSEEDEREVHEALQRVHGLDLAGQDFMTLSDGQRQRIMLARAICQNPKVLILDEPTAYLDIRYKAELLEILKELAHSRGTTIIMSLHEIDLAMKASDYIICVKGDKIAAYGTPEKVTENIGMEELYGMSQGSFNLLLGSMELARPCGAVNTFVVAGDGFGIPIYRNLQRKSIPFATGILYENDVDFQVAKDLGSKVISSKAFEIIGEDELEEAKACVEKCELVIDSGTPIGSLNQANKKLLDFAKNKDIRVIKYNQI